MMHFGSSRITGELEKTSHIVLICLLQTQELKKADAAEAAKGGTVVHHPIWLMETPLNLANLTRAKWAEGGREVTCDVRSGDSEIALQG